MRNRTKKYTAWFFLIIFGIETVYPGMAYALTSGPAQPEMQKFKPAGDSEMVDLFTGNFKYNIPLVDVGGYPLNLSYGSGEGMEDEASWVGFGWSFNPGAINRTLRGLPDDFNGEKIKKDYTRKEFKKIGGNIILKPSFFGWEIAKPSIKVGVYKDNYYGVGAEVGLSLSNQLSKNQTSALNLGLDFSSDNREGASFTPSLSLGQHDDHGAEVATNSFNGSLTYNTRSGLKQISLGASFATSDNSMDAVNLDFNAVKYFGQTYTPSFHTNTRNSGFTFSFDIGPKVFGGYFGLGGNGYTYHEKILEKTIYAPAFGYMHYTNGRRNTNALIDFNREKDGIYVPGTPGIPVPVATHDLFTATGQAGSLQFRPYFNGNYLVFDKAFSNSTNNTTLGLTVGVGNLLQTGGRVNYLEGEAKTGKWVQNNAFLHHNGEPEFDASKPDAEPVHFKQTGELTKVDEAYYDLARKDKTVQVVTNGKYHHYSGAMAWTTFKSHEPVFDQIGNNELKKNKREIRTTSISYLTALQAAKYRTDYLSERMEPGVKNAHHISEITVTDDGGKRMVYGVPVYNRGQYEASFSVEGPQGNNLEKARKTGLITYTPGVENSKSNNKGRDNLFSREHLPAYATSYLLTGVLSPDYVDVTENGITDDDLGTAYKFNYTKTTTGFQWRAPYAENTANFNEGFVSDPKDDKGSYVGGTKELWYLNSVESKTMIAIFETSNREDGLGVKGENGGQNKNVRLKKLDRIKLFSKADWLKNGNNATPIKIVHFEYDYSIHPNVPNNSGDPFNKSGTLLTNPNEIANPAINVNFKKGKLTLKKVYFTFGNNTRGQSNPYEFSYDMRKVTDVFGSTLPAPNPYPYDQSQNAPEVNNEYAMRQADRWGTYKPTWYNRLTGSSATDGKMNNSEFPYVIQKNDDGNTALDYNERTLDDLFASMWQLNKIITPTGSTINIEYEADDYGYVQNRRAMQMCFIKGVGNGTTNNSGMVGANGFTVELPEQVSNDDEFRKRYLKGPDGLMPNNLYYKIYTDLNNQNRYEYVQGYAEIDPAACQLINSTTAFIAFKKLSSNKYSPVSKAAWQMMRSELPQFAYDNYDNSDVSFSQGAIKSLIQAVVNMKEFIEPFEKSASKKGFANRIDLSKSMIRLCNPYYNKIGGGARVRKITFEDAWHEMSHQTGKTARYGQLYEYTVKDAGGLPISTGVAAYEPQIGNEENPFHEPIPYTEKVHWAPDKLHFVERPFCETWFPAASVGYSKVTVTNFGDTYAQGGALEKFSGYIEAEFYTAKDFPTLVDNLPLEPFTYENNILLKLFTCTSVKKVVTSQGFKVEVNDMHGKPKSMKVFDMGGGKLSSTEYFYNVEDEQAETKALKNEVDILKPEEGWKIEPELLGMDVDLVTDARESTDESFGVGVGIYVGKFIIPSPIPIPMFFGAGNFGYNVTRHAYNSISFVKVIHKYGILKKVRTEKNGSSITSENLLWDGETGNVLLTRTQNEFNDYTYAFNYPAYWAEGHEGMGAAYKNIGAVFTNFITGTDGKVPAAYEQYLVSGDELISEDYTRKGWVIKSTVDGSLRFINEEGGFITAIGKFYLLRSGRRNQTGAGVGSIVCMNNPVVQTGTGRSLQFSVANKILDAKAVLYSNEWSVPVPDQLVMYCPPGIYAPQGEPGHYTVHSQSSTECSSLFKASSISGAESRSYLNFNTVSSIPANAQIESVVLRLYATDWSGSSNTSKLERVKQVLDCNQGQATWQNQPPVAASTVVTLPAISSSGYIETNITAMFKEWYSTRDIPQFSVRLSMINGNSGHINFYGAPGMHGFYKPELKVCYKYDACGDPIDQVVNPYVKGVLGNWRPKQSFVYMVDREQKTGAPNLPGGTNIRNSGAYTAFNPFWEFPAAPLLHSNVQVDNPPVTERWVWATKSVYYDGKGNEVESVIPINRDRQGNIDAITNPFRYSTALYGYRESAAIAVATNARHNEIAFDGFEDYNFTLQSNLTQVCPIKRHFDWGLANSGSNWCLFGNCLATDIVHSGRYSWLLSTGSVSITKQAGNAAPPAIKPYAFNGPNGEPTLATNELAKGFAPVPGKQYILSMWVHDGVKTQNKINNLTVSINGQDQGVSSKVVPVVEEWKRLELVFTAGASFNLQLVPGGAIHIDDVRIFPYEGNMSSFVYDDRNMRLMAQLDENNFATFYEYDDEGTPVRVKKETERGVMTIKENRQSFRKRP
ncbi:DNRLRE domain-containing protein [Niastella caeni]|uniref:DNRLRE domain-containing protein n=1 Tax=Niastella caeni TaxID=2569763 RepID=A0A4S8I0N9_9BACT|nr:DNRLRE domain-containing protein [Niastella caeni]THU40044.1 DNRLRE domain-containing protein [Niastella caeni]